MIIKFLKNYKFEILFFAVLGAVLLLNLGASSLWEPDEPRYAEAVREMYETGDFLTPHYNYEYRFDKPIFYYWLIAGSFKLFGMNDFALRFPSAVLTFLTVLFLYLLVHKIYGRAAAVCSSVVLATMFNYIKLGRYAIPDASWIFFITATFYFFLTGFYNPKKTNLHMPLGYVMLAFATITKSPVGAAIPAIVFAVYMVIRKDWSLWKRMKVNIGILILFLISAPWYLYMIFRYKAEYFRYYFVSDHFFRFFTYEFGRARPVWYYIQILLGDFLPCLKTVDRFIYLGIGIELFKSKLDKFSDGIFVIYYDKNKFGVCFEPVRHRDIVFLKEFLKIVGPDSPVAATCFKRWNEFFLNPVPHR